MRSKRACRARSPSEQCRERGLVTVSPRGSPTRVPAVSKACPGNPSSLNLGAMEVAALSLLSKVFRKRNFEFFGAGDCVAKGP